MRYIVTIAFLEVENIAAKLLNQLTKLAVECNFQDSVTTSHHSQFDGDFEFLSAEDAFRFMENTLIEMPEAILSSVETIEDE